MSVIKSMIKGKEKAKEKFKASPALVKIEITRKKILTNLRIIESQLYDYEYQLQHFNSLREQEVLNLYQSLNKFEAITKQLFADSIINNFPKCEKKASDIMERLEDLKDIFNRKLTGIIY